MTRKSLVVHKIMPTTNAAIHLLFRENKEVIVIFSVRRMALSTAATCSVYF
jgi:hypothetical protein